jgi:hypothetical protein
MEVPMSETTCGELGQARLMAECHRNAVPSRSLKMARLWAWQDEQAKDMLKAARAQTADLHKAQRVWALQFTCKPPR